MGCAERERERNGPAQLCSRPADKAGATCHWGLASETVQAMLAVRLEVHRTVEGGLRLRREGDSLAAAVGGRRAHRSSSGRRSGAQRRCR